MHAQLTSDVILCMDTGNSPQFVCAQVRGFWALLETATNERQQAMFRMLNMHLKHLAERVEAAVGELLEVMRAFVPLPGPASSASYADSMPLLG